LACIRQCDLRPCRAIICGNEYTDADAYYYEHKMAGTPNDPRIFCPEILTDQTGNPIHPIGCTGVAQKMSPQLSIANMMSAALAMRLFWWWYAQENKPEAKEWWPVKHGSSAMKQWTVRVNGEMR
jgi:hypothetical protein